MFEFGNVNIVLEMHLNFNFKKQMLDFVSERNFKTRDHFEGGLVPTICAKVFNSLLTVLPTCASN